VYCVPVIVMKVKHSAKAIGASGAAIAAARRFLTAVEVVFTIPSLI
jgi:hypothetical protein